MLPVKATTHDHVNKRIQLSIEHITNSISWSFSSDFPQSWAQLPFLQANNKMQTLAIAKTFNRIQQKILTLPRNSTATLCKWLWVVGLVVYLFYSLLSGQSSTIVKSRHKWMKPPYDYDYSYYYPKTNVSHLMFGIAGSSNTWGKKKMYIESWWKPNKTRGYMFLDRAPVEHLPWPPSSPPFRVSDDTSVYREFNKHAMPFAIRMVRVIVETFRENRNNKGIRWFVMADDDTVLFLDNLVDVLSKYDHRKYFYVGTNSECVLSNFDNSFGMAFGGAGYALSYPLADAVVKNMDLCIKRYPNLFGSDHILQSCIADLGVSLTQENGFHQIDLHRDISGLLSSHPQTPFLSLHHLDVVDPIFPTMNRHESVNHLMKAATADESRLLQQTVCYHKQHNWTLSTSWGYSVQIYESILPPSILQRPLETFSLWRNGARPPYMFNTRFFSNKPCEAPHVFIFDSVERPSGNPNVVITSYSRRSPRRLSSCSSSGNHSADPISKIYVISPLKKLGVVAGSRRECCDVVQVANLSSMAVKLRTCMKDEIVA